MLFACFLMYINFFSYLNQYLVYDSYLSSRSLCVDKKFLF